jgi:hypothetical protein
MAIHGDRLYVGHGAYDLADPLDPQPLAGQFDGNRNYGIAGRGERVATSAQNWPSDILDDQIGLHDLSGMDEPEWHQCLPDKVPVGLTWLADRLLAIGDGGGCTLTIAESGAVQVTTFTGDALGTSVALRGPLAWVSTARPPLDFFELRGSMTGSGGLSAWDLAQPALPRQLSWLDGPAARGAGAAGSGDYLYLVEGALRIGEVAAASRLWVLDAKDPSSPLPLGSAETAGSPGGVVPNGDYVYVPSTSGLEVFDVRDARQPRSIGTRDHPFSEPFVPRFARYGNLLFLGANVGDVVRLYDVRTPAEPVPLALPTAVGYPQDMAIAPDGRAFLLASWTGQLTAVRLGDSGIVAVGDTPVAASARSLAWAMGKLFTLRQASEDAPLYLDIWDATADLGLALRATVPLGYEAEATYWYSAGYLVPDGDRLYLLDDDAGIVALDISEPLRPRPIARLGVPVMDRVLGMEPARNVIFGPRWLVPWSGKLLRSRDMGGLQMFARP